MCQNSCAYKFAPQFLHTFCTFEYHSILNRVVPKTSVIENCTCKYSSVPACILPMGGAEQVAVWAA